MTAKEHDFSDIINKTIDTTVNNCGRKTGILGFDSFVGHGKKIRDVVDLFCVAEP